MLTDAVAMRVLGEARETAMLRVARERAIGILALEARPTVMSTHHTLIDVWKRKAHHVKTRQREAT